MKINPINVVKGANPNIYTGGKTKDSKKAVPGVKDAYAPGKAGPGKMIYSKSKAKVDKGRMAELKAEGEKAYSHLRQLVEMLLTDQGVRHKQATDLYEDKMIEVTEDMRLEAQALIAEGGELSAEKVSDRIVEFAKAASGGDKNKLDMIKGAIDKGFGEAKRVLGGLPDISQRTYDLIMQKLEDWVNEAEE